MPGTDNRLSAALPGHLIRRLHQRSTQIFAQRMKAGGHDLTPIQFAALDALRAEPGIDQARLATAVAKDRATIGGVVDRLEQKGLVSRVVNSADKRARTLKLTDAGVEIVAALSVVVQDLQRDILPGLTADEYAQFVALAVKAAADDTDDQMWRRPA